ncbi:leucine-rich repeat protein [Ruminococcus flavefaciens]|uniref:leucine-rich repeat protein n=1 Tax=Ruminococcus flavefaciens TaxID=1265 RepID=UPI00048B581F|nr:leucine-rich repeat protein [Ruminococcus flavefaciens]
MKKNKMFSVFTSIIMFISLLTIFPPKMVSLSASIDVTDNAEFVYRVYDNYVEAIGYSEKVATAMMRGSEFKGLESYVNNKPVKYISGAALKGAPITKLIIPDTVIEIKTNSVLGGALQDTNIETVSIPKNVKKLGSNSFKNCSKLKSIYFYNPDCQIYGDSDTICNSSGIFTGTIYGYKGSTAEEYAAECGYKFSPIDGQGTSNSQTTTPPPKTTTTTTTIKLSESGTLKNDLKYQIDDFGTLTISGNGKLDVSDNKNCPWYNKKAKIQKIIIMEGIEEIGDFSFYCYSNVTSVIISSSLKSIGKYAFASCDSLISVSLPDGIQNIGYCAFFSCTNLIQINIPSSITIINASAFRLCKSLSSISIPDSVTEIGSGAFANCINLTSVNLPNLLTGIENNIFYNCTNLKSINIPSNVSFINSEAFYNCINIKSIDIPYNVKKLGILALNSATNFDSITIRNPNCEIYDSETTISSHFIKGLRGSTAEEYAKKYNRSFEAIDSQTTTTTTTKNITTTTTFCTSTRTTLTTTKGITSTSQRSVTTGKCGENISFKLDIDGTLYFNGVGGLKKEVYNSWGFDYEIKKVVISDGITSIDDYAFWECKNLQSILIPDSVTEIGEFAFHQCESLKSIVLPNSLTKISYGLFNECRNLLSIELPNSIKEIEPVAFRDCDNLQSIVIPNSVNIIEDEAFFRCKNLNMITINNPKCTINNTALKYNSNTVICGYANSTAEEFANRNGNDFVIISSLESTNITTSITTKQSTFTSVTNYTTTITTPQKMVEVTGKCGENITFTLYSNGVLSFDGEGNLNFNSMLWKESGKVNRIEISNGITSIGNNFSYCQNLSSVKISNTVIKIDAGAFANCKKLESIEIPDSVSEISDRAFEGCTMLESIIIPNSVTTIGSKAFNSTKWFIEKEKENPLVIINGILISGIKCSGDIQIPESVTEIGVDAFLYNGPDGNTQLKSIKIPNSVTKIHENAFSHCTNLKSIEIPDSVTEIGKNAFAGCRELEYVKLSNSIRKIEADTFIYCDNIKSIDIPNSVTIIERGAFDGCYELTNVIFHDYIPSLGSCAFRSTKWLESLKKAYGMVVLNDTLIDGTACKGDIVVPNTVKSIGEGSFIFCEELDSIIIPENVTSIKAWAFSCCSNLNSITIKNPRCKIEDLATDTKVKIYGYNESTAKEYADKNGLEFVSIGTLTTTSSQTTNQTTTTTLQSSQIEYNLGDVNDDGQINAVDASSVLAYYAMISTNKDGGYNEAQKLSADVNNDGQVNAVDASNIMAYYAYLSTTKENIISLAEYINKRK